MGLEALQRKLLPGDPLAADLAELTAMTSESVEELRSYVGALRAPPAADREARSLVAAVQSEAARFRRHHRIAVTVRASEDLDLQPALALEVRHLVREALFNIRRHTASGRALIGLRQEGRRLVMEFVNDEASASARPFLPRSLSERAGALGGRVDVNNRPEGSTSVTIEVPLEPAAQASTAS